MFFSLKNFLQSLKTMKIKGLQKTLLLIFFSTKQRFPEEKHTYYINNVSGAGSAVLLDDGLRGSFFSFSGLDVCNGPTAPFHNLFQLEPPVWPSCARPCVSPDWSGWSRKKTKKEGASLVKK